MSAARATRPSCELANNSVHYQPSYFYLGHFSRYLPRGAVRIMHHFTGSDSSLEITTWLVQVGDGSEGSGLKKSVRRRVRENGVEASRSKVVVVVFNRQDNAAALQITTGWYTAGSLRARLSVRAHSPRRCTLTRPF